MQTFIQLTRGAEKKIIIVNTANIAYCTPITGGTVIHFNNGNEKSFITVRELIEDIYKVIKALK